MRPLRLSGLLFVVACGSEFSGTPSTSSAGTPSTSSAGTPSTSSAGTPSTSDAGTPSTSDAGTPSTSDAGTPSTSDAGTPSTSDAGSGSGGAASCTPLQADKPSMPAALCQLVQNKGCDAGDTCVTLAEREQDGRNLCMPTGITTACADSGCLADFTCACLQADFRFDKTGLEAWKCCDTAAGPLYVLPPLACPR